MTADEARNAAVEEEIPTLEAAEVPQNAKQSKRYAKAMSKMGLKPEANITRVTIRKVGSLSFALNQPEVYRFPGTNTFVVFGEAQLEDMAALSQEAAARAAVAGSATDIATEEEAKGTSAPAIAEEDDDSIDAGELEEKMISLVMKQANCRRGQAIRALQNNAGDMVNAIMELTM